MGVLGGDLGGKGCGYRGKCDLPWVNVVYFFGNGYRGGFGCRLAIWIWGVEKYVEKWESGRDLLGWKMWKTFGEEGEGEFGVK